MTKKIYWRNLTGRHRVKQTKTGWTTAGGAVIYWHGGEAKEAQQALRLMAR